MMHQTIDDFFAMILAVSMIAIELMAILIGAPIMGAYPVLIVEFHNGFGIIHLIPFVTAVTAVLFLYILNLWFSKGFINVIRNIQAQKELAEFKNEELESE